jgi:hypothetical protein
LAGMRSFEKPDTSAARSSSLNLLIHQGTLELRGQLQEKPFLWSIEAVEARLEAGSKRFEMSARPSFLGPHVRLSMSLHPETDKPLRLDLKNARLDSVFKVLGSTQSAPWKGTVLNATAFVPWPDVQPVTVVIERLHAPLWSKGVLRGSFQISTSTVSGQVKCVGLTSPMTVKVRFKFQPAGWDGQVLVDHYTPEITRALVSNYWIRNLEGPGRIELSMTRQRSHRPRFQIQGSDFCFSGTSLQIPEWSAVGKMSRVEVSAQVHSSTQTGTANVRYVQPYTEDPGRLDIALSSMTIQDILDVLSARPKTPLGIEPQVIREGRFEGLIHPEGRLDIRNAIVTLDFLRLDSEGTVELNQQPVNVQLKGQGRGVDVALLQESLGIRPVHWTGTAQTQFDVRWLAGEDWLKSLNGQFDVRAQEGVIAAGKTMYRIAGYLNLTNLLKPSHRLRGKGAGIDYQSAAATFTLSNGVMKTADLKIRTANMDIASRGLIDWPAKTVDMKLELQFLNTVKERLGSLPLIKRIVKSDTGLIQVPLRLRGPLDNVGIE